MLRVTVLYEINEDHIKELAEELGELKEYEEDEESWVEDNFEQILDECTHFYEVQGIL
jgi:hypothetical protein